MPAAGLERLLGLEPFLIQFLKQFLLAIGYFLRDPDGDLDKLVPFPFAAQNRQPISF